MFHLLFDCILFIAIIYELPVGILSQKKLISKPQSQHQGDIFSKSQSFPQGTRLTDDFSILVLEPIAFFQELLQTLAQRKFGRNGKVTFRQLLIYVT